MITKNILREQVKDILLDQMVQGNLQPGNRVSLPSIAKVLGVSVTPVREALTQLIESGLVTYIANRGFFITELSAEEAREIYAAISILEVEAVRHAQYRAEDIDTLRALNTAFHKAQSAAEKLKADMAFHPQLIKPFNNQFLQKLIEDIRIRVFMYEHAFMAETTNQLSVHHHAGIIDHLQKGAIEKAIIYLKNNWTISIEHILELYKLKAS